MEKIKRIRSVIHSTAHHAISGLCYIHPHIGNACKQLNISAIKINLVRLDFSPKLINITNELKLSSEALHEKFNDLLLSENIEIKDIKSTYITFTFSQDNWPKNCYIETITKEGKKLDVAIGSDGKKAEVLHANS